MDVSKEQGLIPETHTHRGRENRMDKSLLSRSALVNLSLWECSWLQRGHLCVGSCIANIETQRPDSLCAALTLSFKQQIENP